MALEAATWKVAIQNASLPTVQAMIHKSKTDQGNRKAGLSLPMLKVFKECFPSHLQKQASKLLGVEFGSLAGSRFIDMTPLQLSLIMQHVCRADSKTESRVQITELLLSELTLEDLTGHNIGKGSNASHLAAFLGMDDTLDKLVAHGCDLLIKNGCSFSALDIKEAMNVSDECLVALLARKTPVQDQQALLNISEAPPEEQVVTKGIDLSTLDNSPRECQDDSNNNTDNHSSHCGDDGSFCQMDNDPQVLELALENKSPSTVIKDFQQPSSSLRVELIEQDALYEQQGHLHFMSQEEYLHASEGDFSDMENERDPTCFLRVMLRTSEKRLFSILKQSQGQSVLPNDIAAEAYRSYLAFLNVQPNLKLQREREEPPSMKTITWEPFTQVRIVRRHISPEDQPFVSDSDSEDSDCALQTYFEPVHDHDSIYFELADDSDEERISLYTEDRPITPFGIMGNHFTNNSSLDLSSLVAHDQPPPFPVYQRPLPVTPSDATKGVTISRHRRSSGPPAPLDMRPLEHYALVGKKTEPLRSPPPPAPYTHLYKGRRSITPTPPPPPSLQSFTKETRLSRTPQPGSEETLPDLNKPLPLIHAGSRGIPNLKSVIQRKWTGRHPLRSLSASIVPMTPGLNDPITGVHRQLSLPIPTRHTSTETETPLQAPKAVTILRSPQLYPDQLLEGPKSFFRRPEGCTSKELPSPESPDGNPPMPPSFGGFVQDLTRPNFQITDRRRGRRDSSAKAAAFMSPSLPDISGLLPRLGIALQTGLQQVIQMSRPSSPINLPRPQSRAGLAIDPKMPAKPTTLESPSSPTSLQSGTSSRRTFASSWSQRKKVVLPTIVVQPSSPDTIATDMEATADDGIRSQDFDPEDLPVHSTSESEQEDDTHLLKKRRVGSLQVKKERPQVLTNLGQDEDFEECNGLSLRFSEWNVPQGDADFKFFASTIANFERLAQGDRVQSYIVRKSISVSRYSDRPRQSSLKVCPWKNMDSMEDNVSQRRTLSNQQYPSTIDTGVLYMRIKNIEQYSLPILEETTMASIRIDTGFEKVDTDYVPLDDLSVLFNQEFCLPVCPGLAITLTLHLMQAPHIQPRYASPQILLTPSPDSGKSNQGFFDEEVHQAIQQRQPEHQQSQSTKSKIISPPLRKQESGSRTPIVWARAAAVAASRSSAFRQRLLLPSVFKSRSQTSTPTTVVSTNGSSSDTPIAKSTPCTSLESLRAGQEEKPVCSVLTDGPQTSTSATSSSCRQELSGTIPSKDSSVCDDKNKSTFLKWKRGIAQSVRQRRRDVKPEEVRLKRARPRSQDIFSIDDVESLRPFNMKFRKGVRTSVQEPHDDRNAAVVISPSGSFVTGEGRDKLTSVPVPEASLAQPSMPPGPLSDGTHLNSSCKTTNSSKHVLPLAKLSMSEIRSTETPLEILTRHILFDDENCIGRSGIVFKELQSSCENTIVPVDFVMVNNWVDRHDYGRVLPTKRGDHQLLLPLDYASKNRDRLLTPPLLPDVTTAVVPQGNDGHDDGDAVSETDTEGDEESLVAKVSTSLCFIPGPMMDPEDVIYEDQDRIPTEPQNLQDCQFGLYYFRWQDRVVFEGPLFYLTERGFWKEGWFRLKGSLLLQQTKKGCSGGSGQHTDEYQRCLNLETVRSLQTNRGVFKATAKYLDGEEEDQDDDHLSQRRMSFRMSFDGEDQNLNDISDDDNDECDRVADYQDEDSFYPVRSGFRLKMRVFNVHGNSSWRTTTRSTVIQDFHAPSPELAQSWVSAIITNCRERPPKPYWLR